MALPASDNFNRSNENPLANSTWTNQYGMDGGVQIVSNQATGVGSGGYPDRGSIWTADTFPNDQYSQFTFRSSNTADGIGLILRGSTTVKTCYYLSYQSGTFYLSRWVNGTFSDIGSPWTTTTLSSGDVVRLEIVGSTITLRVNSTQITTWSDNNIASGSAGIYAGDSGNTADDWSAGSMSSGSSASSSPSTSASSSASNSASNSPSSSPSPSNSASNSPSSSLSSSLSSSPSHSPSSSISNSASSSPSPSHSLSNSVSNSPSASVSNSTSNSPSTSPSPSSSASNSISNSHSPSNSVSSSVSNSASNSPSTSPSLLNISDNFNRSNENPLNNGTWANQYGLNGGCQIVSNQVQGNGTTWADNGSVWVDDTFANDQYSEITFISHNTVSNGVGVIVRGSSSVASCYILTYYDNSGSKIFYMNKWVNGSFSNIGNNSIETLTSGDVLRLNIVGNTLTAYKNGNQFATWNDSDISSGSPGIYMGNVTDNLNIVDNWAGGNLSNSSASLSPSSSPSESNSPSSSVSSSVSSSTSNSASSSPSPSNSVSNSPSYSTSNSASSSPSPSNSPSTSPSSSTSYSPSASASSSVSNSPSSSPSPSNSTSYSPSSSASNSPSSSPSSGTPVIVAINTANTSYSEHDDGGQKHIVRSGNTVVALVTRDQTQDTYRSTDDGDTWSQIDTDGTYSSCLVTDGTDVYHFYRVNASGIYMVRFGFNDETIPAPTQILNQALPTNTQAWGFRYDSVTATIDSDGRIYVAYHYDNDSSSSDSMYVLVSNTTKTTWTPVLIRQGSGGQDSENYTDPSIQVGRDNTIYLSYSTFMDRQYMSRLAISTNQGSSWSDQAIVNGDVIYNTHVLPDPTNADIIYIFAQWSGTQGLVFIKSTNHGSSWSSWTSIDSNPTSTSHYADPTAAFAANGDIYVAYRSTSIPSDPGTDYYQRWARSSNGGTSWDFPFFYYEADPMVTKSSLRYQTFFNGGGPLEGVWLQWEGSNTPQYYAQLPSVTLYDLTLSSSTSSSPSSSTSSSPSVSASYSPSTSISSSPSPSHSISSSLSSSPSSSTSHSPSMSASISLSSSPSISTSASPSSSPSPSSSISSSLSHSLSSSASSSPSPSHSVSSSISSSPSPSNSLSSSPSSSASGGIEHITQMTYYPGPGDAEFDVDITYIIDTYVSGEWNGTSGNLVNFYSSVSGVQSTLDLQTIGNVSPVSYMTFRDIEVINGTITADYTCDGETWNNSGIVFLANSPSSSISFSLSSSPSHSLSSSSSSSPSSSPSPSHSLSSSLSYSPSTSLSNSLSFSASNSLSTSTSNSPSSSPSPSNSLSSSLSTSISNSLSNSASSSPSPSSSVSSSPSIGNSASSSPSTSPSPSSSLSNSPSASVSSSVSSSPSTSFSSSPSSSLSNSVSSSPSPSNSVSSSPSPSSSESNSPSSSISHSLSSSPSSSISNSLSSSISHSPSSSFSSSVSFSPSSSPSIGDIESILVIPSSYEISLGERKQFTAVGLDEYNNQIPGLDFEWSVNGGGTITENGLFTAGGIIGGPYTITVTSGALPPGTATIQIINRLDSINWYRKVFKNIKRRRLVIEYLKTKGYRVVKK